MLGDALQIRCSSTTQSTDQTLTAVLNEAPPGGRCVCGVFLSIQMVLFAHSPPMSHYSRNWGVCVKMNNAWSGEGSSSAWCHQGPQGNAGTAQLVLPAARWWIDSLSYHAHFRSFSLYLPLSFCVRLARPFVSTISLHEAAGSSVHDIWHSGGDKVYEPSLSHTQTQECVSVCELIRVMKPNGLSYPAPPQRACPPHCFTVAVDYAHNLVARQWPMESSLRVGSDMRNNAAMLDFKDLKSYCWNHMCWSSFRSSGNNVTVSLIQQTGFVELKNNKASAVYMLHQLSVINI